MLTAFWLAFGAIHPDRVVKGHPWIVDARIDRGSRPLVLQAVYQMAGFPTIDDDARTLA